MSTPGNHLLTVAEVADRLAVSPATVYRLIEAGELPALKLRSAIRVDPVALTAYLAQANVTVCPPGPVAAPVAEAASQVLIRSILTVLTEVKKPLKGLAIARRCGRKYNSRFRASLAWLVRQGMVVNCQRQGYTLPAQAA